MIYLLLTGVMLCLGFALWFTTRAQRRSGCVADLVARMRPLDLSLFRNLFDYSQDEWLEARLPASDFRAFRAQRRKVMLLYLADLRENLSLLLAAAQLAERSGQIHFQQRGMAVSNASLAASLRITLLAWKLRLRLDTFGKSSPRDLLELYEQLQAALAIPDRPMGVVAEA